MGGVAVVFATFCPDLVSLSPLKRLPELDVVSHQAAAKYVPCLVIEVPSPPSSRHLLPSVHVVKWQEMNVGVGVQNLCIENSLVWEKEKNLQERQHTQC